MARLARIAPEVPVSDMQASLDYYQQQLGFEVAMITPTRDYAIVERDGVAIHLFHAASNTYAPAGLHIFTPDLDELYAEFQTRGAHVHQPITSKPWGNRDFRVTDHSGNELKFTEPR